MMTKNMETKVSGNEGEMYVCAVCGELHPKRFGYVFNKKWERICCSCAYECYALIYDDMRVEPLPLYTSIENETLLVRQAVRIADRYARNLDNNFPIINELDDYRNVYLTMVNHIKSGYSGSLEELFQEVCEDASRRKFTRRCKYYFDSEKLYETFGEVNYDNFEEVFLPTTEEPDEVLKIFKLVKLDSKEVFASVKHMLGEDFDTKLDIAI